MLTDRVKTKKGWGGGYEKKAVAAATETAKDKVVAAGCLYIKEMC